MPQRTAKHRRTQKPAKADSSDTDDNSDDKPTWDGTELKSAPFAHKLKNYLPLQINGLRPFIRYGLINDKRSNTIFFNQEHGTLYLEMCCFEEGGAKALRCVACVLE